MPTKIIRQPAHIDALAHLFGATSDAARELKG